VLYCVVFLARYTDLFGRGQYVYNIIFKIFYILSSFYIIGLMQWVFPRTREKELAWKLGAACFFGALLLSPFTMLIFQGKDEWSMFYVSYSQSTDFPAPPTPNLQRFIDTPIHPGRSGSGTSPTSSSPSAYSRSSFSSARPPCPPSSTATTCSHWACIAGSTS
jgi:hypothetical protein